MAVKPIKQKRSKFLSEWYGVLNKGFQDGTVKIVIPESDYKALKGELEFYEKNDGFYVCPHHQQQQGYESCCSCGGWDKGEEHRLCTENPKSQHKALGLEEKEP